MSVFVGIIATGLEIGAGILATEAVGAVAGAIFDPGDAQGQATAAQSQVGQVAEAGAQERLEFEKEQFAFEKGEYLRKSRLFESIYGPIEQNLGGFFNRLTPEVLATAGLETSAKEFDKARSDIKTFIAQRKTGGGGLEAKLLADVEISEAEERAEIRKEAPFKVAEEQQEFLRLGKAPGAPPKPTGVSGAIEGVTRAQVSSAQTVATAVQAEADITEQNVQKLIAAGTSAFGFANEG